MAVTVLTTIAAALSGAPPPLPGFLNSLASPLEHYGVWAIFLLVFLEDFGIPVPGETVLIAGAVLAGSGHQNVVTVGVTGLVAAVLGDNIGYAIGRFGGRALVERWGRYIFLTKDRLDWAEAFFDRHGGKIIVAARFIEVLRQANGILAGLIHMRWLKFLFFNALGAALWVGTWVCVGYFAGAHITEVYNAITQYTGWAAVAAVLLIAAYVAWRIRKKRRERAATGHAGRVAEDHAGRVAEDTAIGDAATDYTATEPAEPTEPAEATEPAEPTVPAEATEPTGPIAATAPTEPTGPTTPTRAADPLAADRGNGSGRTGGASRTDGADAAGRGRQDS